MRMLLFASLILAGLGLAGGAHAACNFPNPNENGPPFFDDCPLPAHKLNDIAANPRLTNGTAIARTADGQGMGTLDAGITAKQIADWVFCNCSLDVSYDGMRGVGVLTPGSTIDLVNGVGGYVLSRQAIAGAFPTSVALMGMGVADANNAAVWGINTALTDNRGQVTSSGTGRAMYNEFDFNVTSPSTIITGLILGGKSLAQPAQSTGVTLATLDQNSGLTAKWAQGFATLDGATNTALLLGAKSANTGGTTSDGQSLNFASYLAGVGSVRQIWLGSDLQFHITAALNISNGGILDKIATDQDFQVGGPVDLASGISISSHNDANNALKPMELVATQVTISGGVQLHVYTVAQLGAAYTCNAGNEGMLAAVSDANSATFNAALAGGGSNHVMAYCDGTLFKVH